MTPDTANIAPDQGVGATAVGDVTTELGVGPKELGDVTTALSDGAKAMGDATAEQGTLQRSWPPF